MPIDRHDASRRPAMKSDGQGDVVSLVGCWTLIAWHRVGADGATTSPLGEGATGSLVYTPDHRMIVQLVAAGRPPMNSGDPLNGGDVNARAAAYSTSLAYFGTYEVQGQHVVHHVEASLFPDWSGQRQERPYTLDGDILTLHTPPQHLATGDVTNSLIWQRAERFSAATVDDADLETD